MTAEFRDAEAEGGALLEASSAQGGALAHQTAAGGNVLLTERRDALLEAVLPDIPFDGWTVAALRSAADRAGIPPEDVATLFPGGVADAAVWFANWSDRRMLARLEEMSLAEMKVRDRIATALVTRLEMAYPHREAVGRAVAVLAQPLNAPRALASLHATVDAIWYAAGDTSTDVNWYTKRALLGAVYSSVLLYWLNDRSEDFTATRAFIDRRISDVMRLSLLTRPFGSLPANNPLQALFRMTPGAFPLSGILNRLNPLGRRHRMRV